MSETELSPALQRLIRILARAVVRQKLREQQAAAQAAAVAERKPPDRGVPT